MEHHRRCVKDALVLAQNLNSSNFESIAAAIRDYEQQMFGYAGEAQEETDRNEVAMHQPDFSFKKRFAT
ncbi:hypothetical protein [Pedobacter terrae]|uniref:hypothetical protein n=1 Tax=Pedobacter terrae TaxID=405671 RepID=UPI002FFB19A8